MTGGPNPTESSLTWAPMPLQNFEDLKLLHYYTYDLAHTLSLPGAIGRTWSDGVPQLAFEGDQHVYLVHALLAAAAAHKVAKNPDDIQSQRRGQEHYVQSLALIQTLDLNACESHASAALAAVMLLTWYEVYSLPPTHDLLLTLVSLLMLGKWNCGISSFLRRTNL
jgi:Fungal specific transcription factor domain